MTRRWLPDNVTEYKDRHGKPRYRWRRKGFPTHHFQNVPGTEAFRTELAACLSGEPAKIERATPGTIDALCAAFYASPAWRGNMRESSKRTYRSIIERFRTAHGTKPVALIETRHLDAILGKMADRPAAANNLRKTLKRLFDFAVKNGMRKDNPAILTDSYRIAGDGFHTWTDDEIAQFEGHWKLGTKPRLALALMLYTGSRKSDAITLGRQHIDGDRIRIRQIKTGAWVSLRIHSELRAAIDAMPTTNMTFLVTEFEKPFTVAGFGNWFRKRCDEAGLPQCSSHGLRKAMSRRLAELGATMLQGRAVTGHKTDKMFAHYAEQADRARLADAAMANLETGFANTDKKG